MYNSHKLPDVLFLVASKILMSIGRVSGIACPFLFMCPWYITPCWCRAWPHAVSATWPSCNESCRALHMYIDMVYYACLRKSGSYIRDLWPKSFTHPIILKHTGHVILSVFGYDIHMYNTYGMPWFQHIHVRTFTIYVPNFIVHCTCTVIYSMLYSRLWEWDVSLLSTSWVAIIIIIVSHIIYSASVHVRIYCLLH